MPPKKRAAAKAAAETAPRRSARAAGAPSTSSRSTRVAAKAAVETSEPISKSSKSTPKEVAKKGASEIEAQPKRRGRPPKAAAAAVEAEREDLKETEAPPTRRGRGRAKQQGEEPPPVEEAPAPTRGRGRPKQKPVEEPEVEEAPAPKRGRGRAKQQQEEEPEAAQAEEAPKRRGRPAKNSTAAAAKPTEAAQPTTSRRGRAARKPEDLPIGEQTQAAEATEQLQEELQEAIEDVDAAPKRRGRPRKNDAPPKATEPEPAAGKKRGRGATKADEDKVEDPEEPTSGRAKRTRTSKEEAAEEPPPRADSRSRRQTLPAKTSERPAQSNSSRRKTTHTATGGSAAVKKEDAAPETEAKSRRKTLPAKASEASAKRGSGRRKNTAAAIETETPDAAEEEPPATAKRAPKPKTPAKEEAEPVTAKGRKRKSEAVTKSAANPAPAKRSRKSAPAKIAEDEEDEDDGENVEMTDEFGRHFWVMKAEPDSRIEKGKDVKFSIDDLQACTEPEPWSGVRNAVARNNMQAMNVGDLAFFCHSNTKVPGIAGIMEIVREATVDETALDKADPYYDEKSDPEKPKWFNVHVEFRQKLPEVLGLARLKEHSDGKLRNMQYLKQSRLSVSKVTKPEWDFVMELAGAETPPPTDVTVVRTESAAVLSTAEADKPKSRLSAAVDGFLSAFTPKKGSRATSVGPPTLQTPAATSKRASSAQPSFEPAPTSSGALATVTEDDTTGAVPPAFLLRSSPPASGATTVEANGESAGIINGTTGLEEDNTANISNDFGFVGDMIASNGSGEQTLAGAEVETTEEIITMGDADVDMPPAPPAVLLETPVEEAMRAAQGEMETSLF